MGEVTIIYHANPEAKPAPGETEKSRSADAATKKRRAFPRRAQVPHVAAPSSLSITHTRGEHRPRLNAHIQSPSTTQRNARLFRRRAQSGGERARVRGLSDITCRQTRPRGPPRELEHVTTRRRGEHVRGHGGGCCRHDPPALPPVTHHPRVVCGLQAQSYFVVIPSKIRGWSSAKANPRNAIIRFSEELANLQFDLLANLFTIQSRCRMLLLLLAASRAPHHSSSSWTSGYWCARRRCLACLYDSGAHTSRLALQIVLRDGRHLVGTMRCFDQFSNVVMEDTYERHVVDGLYGDIPLGLYMIRGDSIVLAGELDDRDSSESALKQVGGSDRELPNADR